jgi:hypothetical protein
VGAGGDVGDAVGAAWCSVFAVDCPAGDVVVADALGRTEGSVTGAGVEVAGSLSLPDPSTLGGELGAPEVETSTSSSMSAAAPHPARTNHARLRKFGR